MRHERAGDYGHRTGAIRDLPDQGHDYIYVVIYDSRFL